MRAKLGTLEVHPTTPTLMIPNRQFINLSIPDCPLTLILS
jgi:hypothetical protein